MQPTKKITKFKNYSYVFLLALVFISWNCNNSSSTASLVSSRTKIKFYTMFMDSADVKEFIDDTTAKAIIFQHDNYFLKDSSRLTFELSKAYSINKKGKKLREYILVKDAPTPVEVKNDVFFGNMNVSHKSLTDFMSTTTNYLGLRFVPRKESTLPDPRYMSYDVYIVLGSSNKTDSSYHSQYTSGSLELNPTPPYDSSEE